MAGNPDTLTAEEYMSLEEIAKGLFAGKIPDGHAEKLERLGLIAKRQLEYIITENGEWLLRHGQPR